MKYSKAYYGINIAKIILSEDLVEENNIIASLQGKVTLS